MAQLLRPTRGGFFRPFGTAWFIREFLAGRGPEGSPTIDPSIGAPQTDIQAEYKAALHRAFAEDMVAKEEERRIKRGLEPLTAEEAEYRLAWYMDRIPMKFTRMRYHSFLVYCGVLKRLGWLEETEKTEPSTVQENYPPAPPRKYYRLTDSGRAATELQLSDPVMTLYPEYDRKMRSAKNRKYIKAWAERKRV